MHLNCLIESSKVSFLAAVILSLILSVSSLGAATIYVSPVSGGDGTTPENPTTLQEALTAAQANGEADTLLLTRGEYVGNFTYSPVMLENFDLTVEGGWNTAYTFRNLDPTNTILNGNQTGRVLDLDRSNGTAGSLKVEGLTIRNGTFANAVGLRAMTYSPGTITINRNIIEDNVVNTSGQGYAGLYAETSDITSKTGSDIVISNNIIRRNTGLAGPGGFYGGASGCLDLFNNLIHDNTALQGGGTAGGGLIRAFNGQAYVANNTIIGNSASAHAGGIYLDFPATAWNKVDYYLYNNIITGNVCVDEDITEDIGNGISATSPYPESTLTVTNTYYGVMGGVGSGVVSPVESNNMIGATPLLDSNYRPTSGSPVIDAGANSPTGFTLPVADLDGRRRILYGGIGNIVDMGAFEFDSSPLADATGNGDPQIAYDSVNKRFLSVYAQADGTGGATLHGRLIKPDGTAYSADFAISDQKSYDRLRSGVAYDSYHKKFIVVWDMFNGSTEGSDLQGQLLKPDGTLDGPNFIISDQAQVDEWKPAIAYDDCAHQTLVVWNRTSGAETDVYGRYFVKEVPQTDSFAVSAEAGSVQNDPAVAFDNNHKKFLVVWADERYKATEGADIFGQLYNPDRTPNGGNFTVTEGRGADQTRPSLAFNPSLKQYLVVWTDALAGNTDIYSRLVKYDKTLVGSLFPISSTGANQDSASVAFHPLARRFLAVWADDRDTIATGRNIYGQWIMEDSTLQDTNFPIINTAGAQDFPKVAYGPGSFLAVYENQGTVIRTGLIGNGTPVLDVGFVEVEYLGLTAKGIGNGTGTIVSDAGGIDFRYPAVYEQTTPILAAGTPMVITATGDPEVSVSWKGYCTAAGGLEAGNGTGVATCTFAAMDGYKWVKATFTQYKVWLPLILK